MGSLPICLIELVGDFSYQLTTQKVVHNMAFPVQKWKPDDGCGDIIRHLYIYGCVINVIAIRDSHRMLPSIFGYVWHRTSLKKLQVGRSACFIPAHSAPRHRRESTGFDRCHRRPQRDHDLRDVRQLVRSIMGGCTKVVFQATISMLVGGMLAHQFT